MARGLQSFLTQATKSLRGRPRDESESAEHALQYVRENARQGDADSVLAALDTFSRERTPLMNIGEKKGRILDEVVRRTPNGRILELGSFIGYSAVRIARQLGIEGRLICIEENHRYGEIVRDMVEFAGLSGRVTVMFGRAEEVIPTLAPAVPFDAIFVDHAEERYGPDLLLMEKRRILRKGTVLVADNVGVSKEKVRDYLLHVSTSGRYVTENYKIRLDDDDRTEDAVEISVFQGYH